MTQFYFTGLDDKKYPYKDMDWTTDKYVPVENWFKLNGERHLANAISYASAGYPDHYYEGSMRKAIYNLDKAKPLTLDEYVKMLSPLMNDVGRRILDDTALFKEIYSSFPEPTRMEKFKSRMRNFKVRMKHIWVIVSGRDYDMEIW